jgi:iron complex transport system substrate-binding protein
LRIVSLLGSATEIVFELGLDEHLVGISHECDYPPRALELPRLSKPRFDPNGMTSGEVDAAVRSCMAEHGSVYTIDRQLLEQLKPDLVLTQAVCEVCAVPTGSVEEAVAHLSSSATVVSLDAHSIAGIIRTFHQVAEAAGEPQRGFAMADRMEARLEAVRSRVAGKDRPRVLMLEWLDPPFAPGHWVPEMVTAAGGENLLGEAEKRSVEIQWELVEASGRDADHLLIEPCGFDLEGARKDADRHRERLHRLGDGAVEEERAWVLHSAWFSRSGPRIVDGVEALARIFHPDLFDDPPDRQIAQRYS